MWPTTFDVRLASWAQLRDHTQPLPLEQALITINQWWFNSPWRPYYLHWDDIKTWPDPWQLLSDDVYCDLARGLGIVYTISMLDRADMTPATLVLTEDDTNLVLVAKEKYILNWEANQIVNTFTKVKIKRQYQQEQITYQ
jgi:hypothetical protein